MLAARSAPFMAFKYSVCSGVQADGPAAVEDGLGAEDSADVASELEQAESPRVRVANKAIARAADFFESIFNTL